MKRTRERGSALLVALGILVLLSLMGVTFVILARMEMQAARNFDYVVRADFISETGVARATVELGTLYRGPAFGPRYDDDMEPGVTNLQFASEKPYRSTIAAAHCQTWGARAIEGRAAPSTYRALEAMVMPEPGSTESAPYQWSGPWRGRLADGYYDVRYATTVDDVDGTAGETFRAVRGVVDLSGLVNVNRANAALLEGLLKYFGIRTGSEAATAAAIVSSVSTEGPFQYVYELVDRDVLTAEELFGEDLNNNNILDPNENDGFGGSAPDDDGDGLLDGSLKDVVTVFPVATAGIQPINVNTAPEAVLFAVFYGIPSVDEATARTLARAVIEYRSGDDGQNPSPDSVEALRSERDPDGDGDTSDASDLTGDGSDDDIFSDDNPFDGLVSIAFTAPADWLPEFDDDGLDNEGDSVPHEAVASGPPLDRFLLPNGPGGFSEFEFFMDNSGLGLGLSQAQIDDVKDNATTRSDLYTDNGWTAPFRYDSDAWLVISEGIAAQNGEVLARSLVHAVVRYR